MQCAHLRKGEEEEIYRRENCQQNVIDAASWLWLLNLLLYLTSTFCARKTASSYSFSFSRKFYPFCVLICTAQSVTHIIYVISRTLQSVIKTKDFFFFVMN